ncbi:hypothetical protein [Agrobacterium fabrum]|jgi:hypothetical protein|nr:hypothetical protein [Agrobacterium fabrum]MCR6726244.1 hypothetical protein [Agrobacterium fabrum]NTE62543.1 hypothetical protein [Agrobacterium fabrum]
MLQMAASPRFNRLHAQISDGCLKRTLLFTAVDGSFAGKTTQTQAIETNH